MKKLKLEVGRKMLTKEQMKKISGGCTPSCRHYTHYSGYNYNFDSYGDCVTMAEAEQQPGNYCCDSCSDHGFPSCC